MSAVTLAAYLPGTVRVEDYADLVRMSLCIEYLRARRVMDIVDGIRIATGGATIPEHWYDLLTRTPEDRAAWKTEEFRREGTGR